MADISSAFQRGMQMAMQGGGVQQGGTGELLTGIGQSLLGAYKEKVSKEEEEELEVKKLQRQIKLEKAKAQIKKELGQDVDLKDAILAKFMGIDMSELRGGGAGGAGGLPSQFPEAPQAGKLPGITQFPSTKPTGGRGGFEIAPEQTIGGIKFEQPGIKAERKAEEKRATEQVAKDIRLQSALGLTQQNLSQVSGSVGRLAETYVKGVEEGGIGGLGRAIVSRGALTIGGRAGAQFPATGAFEGQKTEVVAKMMPLLTQQGDKPGSVRLVSTVFEKLLKTLPSKNTPPEVAKAQMEATVKNMFGFAKAIKEMGITNETVQGMSKEQAEALGNSIEFYANKVKLRPEEEAQLNSLLDVIMKPINDLIAKQQGGQTLSDEQAYREYLKIRK